MKRWLPFVKSGPTVAVLRLNGAIGLGGRMALSDTSLAPLIEKVFKRGKPDAVALEINSPGGSPVQSSLIAGRIRRQAAEKNIPVIAFVEDVAASGGYWLASAADEIYADHSSIIGSIGVISAPMSFLPVKGSNGGCIPLARPRAFSIPSSRKRKRMWCGCGACSTSCM